jgi:hypothetical protein
MRRARVFPLFRRFRGGRKKTVSMFRSSGRGLQRRFRDSCFLDLRASAKLACRILNRELIFFSLLRRSAARLKRTQTRAEKTKKGAANLPLLPVGVNRLGRYFEKRRTTARASGHSSRRANGGFRTAKRAARGFASLGGGSTREKVRISVASARTPRAPSRNRRFRRCSFFLLSRRPAFRGNRHPATRPGGGRDEGSETRSVARDSDARALTDHTPRSRSPPRRTETRLRVRGPNALGLEKRRANNDRPPTVSTR